MFSPVFTFHEDGAFGEVKTLLLSARWECVAAGIFVLPEESLVDLCNDAQQKGNNHHRLPAEGP